MSHPEFAIDNSTFDSVNQKIEENPDTFKFEGNPEHMEAPKLSSFKTESSHSINSDEFEKLEAECLQMESKNVDLLNDFNHGSPVDGSQENHVPVGSGFPTIPELEHQENGFGAEFHSGERNGISAEFIPEENAGIGGKIDLLDSKYSENHQSGLHEPPSPVYEGSNDFMNTDYSNSAPQDLLGESEPRTNDFLHEGIEEKGSSPVLAELSPAISPEPRLPSPCFREPSPERREPSPEPKNSGFREPSPQLRESSQELRQPIPQFRESSPEIREPSPQFREPSPQFREPSPEIREPSSQFREPSPEIREPSPQFREPSPEFRESSPQFHEPSPEFREPSPEFREPSPEFREPSPQFHEPSPEPREPSPVFVEKKVDTFTPVVPESMKSSEVEPIVTTKHEPKLFTKESQNKKNIFCVDLLTPVVNLIYWRDVKKSGVAFGTIMLILLSLAYFSFISVLAYTSLTLLTGTIAFRLYKNVMQAIQKSQDGHPFKKYLEMDTNLQADQMHEMTDVVVSQINSAVHELKRLFLVEDLIDSVKFGCLLWCLTYLGSWFNGLTLVILGVLSLFSMPKVYEQNQAQIDQYLGLAKGHFNDVMSKVKAAIPIGNKEKDKAQ